MAGPAVEKAAVKAEPEEQQKATSTVKAKAAGRGSDTGTPGKTGGTAKPERVKKEYTLTGQTKDTPDEVSSF